MKLTWHNYRYFPYERDLAEREIAKLLKPKSISHVENNILLTEPKSPEEAKRLVYFSGIIEQSGLVNKTNQALLERVNGNGPNRQSTRYSAHGLHEYKGKFNPQMAKAMLNILGAQPGDLALDPFCGSGTSLVECDHLGIQGTGIDVNPLAIFLANAKLKALTTNADRLRAAGDKALSLSKRSKILPDGSDERGLYLSSWFESDILTDLERLRSGIQAVGHSYSSVLLAVASNCLRDYSLQDPDDLRIRRRTSPLPEKPFYDAFKEELNSFCEKLADAQNVFKIREFGPIRYRSKAYLDDCRSLHTSKQLKGKKFQIALTSPPYATALPYIDTQRLSLVWLNLLNPSNILRLEAELLGSREIRGETRKDLLTALDENSSNIPDREIALCRQLQSALIPTDGFRRQAVPRLLYRYFSGMADSFASVKMMMRKNSCFALVIGGNHTVLGGTRFDINTPDHLARLAESRGWKHEETIPLQTYRRYGLHQNNATTTEALVILRA